MSVFSRPANAQSQKIRFDHLSSDKGLSQNWVHVVYQDTYGFIWIGTENGLNLCIWVNQTVSTMSTDREKQLYEIVVVQDITVRKDRKSGKGIREKEVLLKENHHRVKNNMQIIVSLIWMQSEQLADSDVHWRQSS